MLREAALVGLVDDDRLVAAEVRVVAGLGEQDAVGHQLDRGLAREPVLEAHLEAHHVAQRGLQLFGDALGHGTGGDAARLCVADEAATLAGLGVDPPAPHGKCDLGQLRGLARAGFAADDDDLVFADGCLDLVAARRHGQRVGELQVQGGRGQGGTSVKIGELPIIPCPHAPCSRSSPDVQRLQLHLRPVVPFGRAVHPQTPRQHPGGGHRG